MNYIAWDTETTGLPKTKYGEKAIINFGVR